MVVSEKSLKRLRDFLTSSIKVKYRFESLESFHEFANELEIAEFYEAKSDLMLLFLFECYLLMVGKVWVLTGAENEEKEAIKFAFGRVKIENELKSADSENDESEDIEEGEHPETLLQQLPYVDKLITISRKIRPTNSEFQNKWLLSLGKETKMDEFLKFPVIFAKLLQYVSIGRIFSSPLAPFLVGMVKRLLHKDNLAVLRVEGLKMLLNLLKAASHEPKHPITIDCTLVFASLINIEALKTGLPCKNVITDIGETELLPIISLNLSEFEGSVNGVDLEMLNEIFSFITWDLNPDLLSTRFLYNLLKDSFLSKLFPIAYNAVDLHSKDFDVNVRGCITELVIDYLALWFLKSDTRTFKFGSSLMASSNESIDLGKNQFGSMVSLVVNDLSNFLGVGNANTNVTGGGSMTPRRQMSRVSMLTSGTHVTKNESPLASFLLEEVVLGSKRDVLFVHLILKSACYTLNYARNLFSIKLALEIFRSWLFNPSARRPQFLQDSLELDGFIEFYLDSLEGLFPNKHLKTADMGDFEGLETTLVDRVDVYREAVYFFRAVALQAFFSLSFERWLQLLRIEIEVVELLLEPENLLERPFFTTEDALLAETLLGSLLRSCEYFLSQESMRLKWREASRVISKCSACRGVIEEWCRVIEALSVLLVKDPRYTTQKATENLSRSVSVNLSPAISTSTISTANSSSGTGNGSLPPTTSSFSAWPDLPSVKINAVLLFRNMLRILGDPVASLPELRLNRPDLMAAAFESMERCLDVLMKCRLDQPVKIPLKCVPPIGDLLPPALSALLHLKSYNSIISVKSTGPKHQVAHDSSRIIAWKIVGTVMFRPMDVIIPDHYWGALLVVSRDCLDQPMSAAEFSALMFHVGVPISMAQVPGTTLILSEIVDGMLRFFNDTLWSGNSAAAFSASEASVLIPVTMTIVSNCLKLAKMFPERFGHFRDEACLLRLIKMLIGTISDSQLLTTIHTALAEIYCSECVTESDDDTAHNEFAQIVLKLMLDDPLKFTRGKSHVHVINCLCEYISALAHLKTNSKLKLNDEFILKKLIEAVRIGSKFEEYSEAIVRIIQGPLSDWILYAYQGRLSEELKRSICELFDLQFVSSSVKTLIDQFAVRMLTFSLAFPASLGPKFIGSEKFDCGQTLPLIHLALTPSQTLLSFESDSITGDIFVIARNSFGKFIWKMRDIWSNDSDELDELDESVNVLSLGFEKVLNDSEFPAPQISQISSDQLGSDFKFEMTDVLKTFLTDLKETHPEILKNRSNFYDLSLLDDNWREQFEFENNFEYEKHSEVNVNRFERKRPAFTSGRLSVKLRLLLSSLSLTFPELYTSQPGFGIEVLKSDSSTVNLYEEFRSLDEISGRFKIKIGCIYLNDGISDETDLFNTLNNSDYSGKDYQNYRDFIESFVSDKPAGLFTPQIELEIDELTQMKRDTPEGNFKKYLGNDSVVVIWHGVDCDTLIDRAPFKSDVTTALIRIRSHGTLPGWCIVTLQTCYEKLLQPRKYARVRVDPFTLAEIDEQLELEVDGVFFGSRGCSVQREGILVPIGSVGAVVRALACAAWRQAYLINCIRSASVASSSSSNPTVINTSANNRVKYSPDIVRRDRIEEIIKRYGMAELSYENFLSGLFQNQ